MFDLPERFSRKDLFIGFLLFAFLLALGQDYLLPSQYYDLESRPRTTKGRSIGVEYLPNRRRYDYDIVVSYYNEPIETLEETLSTVKNKLGSGSKRVIIYHKSNENSDALLRLSSEVVPLKNVGREGATYLSHIVRHYHTGRTDFADHTLFLQPHLAWHWVITPRLSTITHNTGFMSLGPYLNMTRGRDTNGNEFPRINDIFSMFRQKISPPHSILATWAGQFVVSKERILGNTFESYRNLLDMFEVEKDHWIYKEGWWNNEPSNPTLGHALERSWPLVFDCYDASMARTCGEGSGSTCQCRD